MRSLKAQCFQRAFIERAKYFQNFSWPYRVISKTYDEKEIGSASLAVATGVSSSSLNRIVAFPGNVNLFFRSRRTIASNEYVTRAASARFAMRPIRSIAPDQLESRNRADYLIFINAIRAPLAGRWPLAG